MSVCSHRVCSKSAISFEVELLNLVFGCIMGSMGIVYYFWVAVTLTLTSELSYRIIVSGASLMYCIISDRKVL